MFSIEGLLPLPPVVWRPRDPERFPDRNAAAYMRRAFARGVIAPDVIAALEEVDAAVLLWVALTKIDTPRLGAASELVALALDIPALALATDGAGAYLIVFDVNSEDMDVMAATQFQHNAAQTFDPNLPLQGDVEPAILLAQAPQAPVEVQEEKRVAHSADDDSPANAAHALNIRPDVQDTPSGTATVTTIKNKEYEAFPDAESARAYLDAMLEGNAPETSPQPTPEQEAAKEAAQQVADEVAPKADPAVAAEHEAVVQRQAEESAHRQEAEMMSRNGEDFPDAESVHAHLEAMLEGNPGHGAEDEPQHEVERIAGVEQGRNGGRDMF